MSAAGAILLALACVSSFIGGAVAGVGVMKTLVPSKRSWWIAADGRKIVFWHMAASAVLFAAGLWLLL